MKTTIKVLLLFLITSLSIITQPAKAQQGISFQIFFDELSPYGTWINDAEYGYVWIPRVAAGFTPYSTNGYWVFTDQGWTWVSNYPWGWAPFHYGRWYYDNMYGSIWIPDNNWGPGWVSWCHSGGYYGWEPMYPTYGSHGGHGDHGHLHGQHHSDQHWTFVNGRDLGREDLSRHYVKTNQNSQYLNASQAINNDRTDRDRNTTYNAGPPQADIEKLHGKSITPVTLRDYDKPGQQVSKSQVQLYRPNIEGRKANETESRPKQVSELKDVKSNGRMNNTSPTKSPTKRDQLTNPPVLQQQSNPQRMEQKNPKVPQRITPVPNPQRQNNQAPNPRANNQQVMSPRRETTQPSRQASQPSRQQSQPFRQQSQPTRSASQPRNQNNNSNQGVGNSDRRK